MMSIRSMASTDLDLAFELAASIRPDHRAEQLRCIIQVLATGLNVGFSDEAQFPIVCQHIANLFPVAFLHGETESERIIKLAIEINRCGTRWQQAKSAIDELAGERTDFLERGTGYVGFTELLEQPETLILIERHAVPSAEIKLKDQLYSKGLLQVGPTGDTIAQLSIDAEVRRTTKRIGKSFRRLGEISTASKYRSSVTLRTAAARGLIEDVKMLLEWTNPNARSPDRWTALMLASRYGEAEIVRLLIDKGADVNSTTSWGVSPLMLAGLFGHEALFEELLHHGASGIETDYRGCTAHDYRDLSTRFVVQ